MSPNRRDRAHTGKTGDAQLRHDAQATTADNGERMPDQPPSRTTFEGWIAYWRPITREWPRMDPEGIAAVASVVARIDRRRADGSEGGEGGDGQNPGAQ
ncbi:hypothetical protein ACFU44_33360 [Nocardia rhizosphaerihabitans]|uniref:hypothetical protein n=1 Tax=Nocardia rhizosphaerihabitans TaxID=1691570 RepID=UPI00366F4A45